MNIKEAIGNLRYLISDDCTDTQYDFIEEIKMAISAMEKQIGKKPHKNYESYSAKWCDCGWYLGFKRDGKNYCPECGQRIDWTD